MIGDNIIDRVASLLQTEKAQSLLTSTPIVISAATVLGLFAVRQIHRRASRRAANNYAEDDTWNWSKEIVVLTGGSSGIGLEIANILGEKRVKVIVIDLNPPKQNLEPNQYFFKLDVSSFPDIKKVAEEIRKVHGHPTVLINNAGIGNALPILKIPESKLRSIFDVNILSHFMLLQEFLPQMVKTNHGHIVTTASLASFSTQATNVDYACTKAGVLSLHEGLLQELKHVYNAPNVRSSVVHPTWVATPLIRPLLESGELKGAVQARDVAEAVVKQLYSGYGRQIIVPESLWWTSTIRGLPTWLQENLRDHVSQELLKSGKLLQAKR